MFLKSIELQGFKSFPDKTVLNFHKGITAVVGPNGSGKSNISDAVMWVLGEQSTKSLRGSKMEDVIFSGTAARKAQGFAQVKLVLDNTDRQLDYDKDELSVTRRYYRSGESEYMIDGATVRLRDVNELFMDTGLGRDGYSIVSQGKIADIISAKTDERRKIFEEAAGISRYRYRRQDAQRKLNQAEENMVRLLDIKDELEHRVGPLKEQSEKAEKFLKLSEEKKTLEIGLWLDLISKSNDKLREQEKKISIAAAQYEQCESDLAEIEKENGEIYNSVAQSNLVIEALRQQSSKAEEDAIRKENDINLLKQQILHNEDTVKRINAEAEQAGNGEHSVDEAIAEKNKRIELLKKQTDDKREELEKQSLGMRELMDDNEAYGEKFADLTAKVSELQLKLSDLKVEKSTAVSGAEEIRSRSENIDEAVAEGEEKLKTADEEREAAQARLRECEDSRTSLQNSLEGYNLKLISERKKAEEIKKECDELNLKAYNSAQKLSVLEELQKNMEGYSGAVKSVLRESRHKALRGIHGALADLIQVDNEYSLAVETALGNAVQNIVTDSEGDAKRAIYFLKNRKLGRVTFLPISAIKPRAISEKGVSECEGFVAFAPELVGSDGRYRAVIENLLGKTAVAEDLDSAINIAKRYKYSFKIVTLDGQVVNAGGSITGGSGAKISGVLSRANEIEALKKKSAELKEKAEQAYAKSKSASEKYNRTLAQTDALKADIISAGEEIIRAQGELTLANDRFEERALAVDALKQEKSDAAGRIEMLKKAQTQAEEKIKSTQEEISALENKIDVVNADKELINEKREKINDIINRISIEIAECKKDISSETEGIKLLTLQKLDHARRAAEIADETARIKQQNEGYEAEIEKAQSEREQLKEKSASDNAEIEKIISSRSEYEKRSAELRQKEKEISARREKLSAEKARLNERKINMENEYQTTVAKLYDEYELTRTQAEELGIVIENAAEASRSLGKIKAQIRSLGNVNVGAIEEYREVRDRYEFMSLQLDDIEKSRRELSKLISELTNNMSARFTEEFKKINAEFGGTMREFFDGGKAELVLEDEEHILESGIEIKVQPPGKNVQNIALLSGGEKSLAAVALLFAILKVTPAPFCIYDEVEAALDDVNVDRYAKYMRKMCSHIQFIAITHRRGTMEEADVLYGVTMQEKGVSKLLELKAAEIAEELGK